MRLLLTFLFAATILFTSASAVPATTDSGNTNTMKVKSPAVLQLDRALTAEERDTSTKRFLRKRHTTDAVDEERSIISDIGSKLKRLAVYNKWIFSGKKPAAVTDPRYAGYWNFYYNRMVRGGKYA